MCLEYHHMLMLATDINHKVPDHPISAWTGRGVYMEVQRKKNSYLKTLGKSGVDALGQK